MWVHIPVGISVNLLWTPHDLASVYARGAQIPTVLGAHDLVPSRIMKSQGFALDTLGGESGPWKEVRLSF